MQNKTQSLEQTEKQPFKYWDRRAHYKAHLRLIQFATHKRKNIVLQRWNLRAPLAQEQAKEKGYVTHSLFGHVTNVPMQMSQS